jgi:hypothetical protein
LTGAPRPVLWRSIPVNSEEDVMAQKLWVTVWSVFPHETGNAEPLREKL